MAPYVFSSKETSNGLCDAIAGVAMRICTQCIVCKAVIRVVRKDIMMAAGPLQVCSGIGSGCEATVRAMREVFDESEVEGALLLDATSAFNALN